MNVIYDNDVENKYCNTPVFPVSTYMTYTPPASSKKGILWYQSPVTVSASIVFKGSLKAGCKETNWFFNVTA